MALLVPTLDLGDGSTVANAYVRAQVAHEIRDPKLHEGQRTIEYLAMRRIVRTETLPSGLEVERTYFTKVGSVRTLFPVDAETPIHSQLYAHLMTDPAFAEAVSDEE